MIKKHMIKSETSSRRMGNSRRSWLGIVRRKFFPSPCENIIVIHTNNATSTSFSEEAALASTRISHEITTQLETAAQASVTPPQRKRNSTSLSKEDIAAIKIQAFFRGHLARQALRALRSLVKLQAVVRGVCVRRQARIALHCMHALARLQVTVRARQLLSRCSSADY